MPRRHLLLMRYVLLNVVGAGGLVAAYFQGWVGLVLRSDVTNFCVGIFIVFLCGLALCSYHVTGISRRLLLAETLLSLDPSAREPRLPPGSDLARYLARARGLDSGARSNLAAALQHGLGHRIGHVRYLANSLVVLGLIGTVVGFIIALSGVDPKIATDPQSVSPMIATLIEGMSVALYTTLVGAVLSVWLGACYQMLATGAGNLFTLLVDLAEPTTSAS